MVLTGTFNSTTNFHYPNDTSQSWIYATAVHAPQVLQAFPLEYTPVNSLFIDNNFVYRTMMFFNLILFISLQSIHSTDGVSNLRDQSDEIDLVHSEPLIEVAKMSGFSQTTSRTHQTHVFRESIASGLSNRNDIVKMGRVSPNEIHEIIFHIQGRNHDELTRVVHDVSDPESLNYGKYLTRKEISEMTSNSDSHDYITNYLESAGANVLSESISGEYITAAAPIKLWEEILDTEFFSYHQIENQHKITNRVVRADQYSVPKQLDKHIAAAFNTIQMPFSIWAQPILEPVEDDVMGSIRAHVASGFIDPAVLKAYYNIDSDVGNAGATQAVYETIGQYYSPADLRQFQDMFSLRPRAVDIDVGGHASDLICQTSPRRCVESNLDIQYIMAISQASPSYSFYTNLNSFASWLVTVSNMANIPLVISISYGANEAEVTQSEFDAFNFQAMKLSAMGVTIVVATGGIINYYYSKFFLLHFKILVLHLFAFYP
jgi:subtilase family serine protease